MDMQGLINNAYPYIFVQIKKKTECTNESRIEKISTQSIRLSEIRKTINVLLISNTGSSPQIYELTEMSA